VTYQIIDVLRRWTIIANVQVGNMGDENEIGGSIQVKLPQGGKLSEKL